MTIAESRLTELEMRVAFQENTIQELNDVVFEQQKKLDSLTREIVLLKNHMQSTAQSPIATQAEETPPPHY